MGNIWRRLFGWEADGWWGWGRDLCLVPWAVNPAVIGISPFPVIPGKRNAAAAVRGCGTGDGQDAVGPGCSRVFSVIFGIGVIYWCVKDTPSWLRRARGQVPTFPSPYPPFPHPFFSPVWGFPLIPLGTIPICSTPGCSPSPFCQGRFGFFLSS